MRPNVIGILEGRGIWPSVQRVAVGIKLVPILAVGTIGLFWIRPENLTPLNPSGLPIATKKSEIGWY